MSKYGIQTKGTSPILLDKGPHGHASQPNLSTYDKGGRVGLKKGGDTRVKKFGGGRTDLIEELGRVEAEPSNRNRRDEISRVHGELNKGYNKGGRVGLKHGSGKKGTKHGLIVGKLMGQDKAWKRHDERSAEAAHELAKRGKKQPSFFSDTGKSHGKGHRVPDTERNRKRWKKHITTKKNEGGRVGLKKGGDDKWIQKVDASIKRRGTKGKCTPITKKGCTGRAKALAKTFKKMAAKRKS